MVDQIAIVKVAVSNTAVVPFTKDFTSPNITEAFSAAVLLFSRTNTDDSAVAGGFIGVGFIGVNGLQAESSLQCSIGPGFENGVAANAGGLTARSATTCIRIPNNAVAALRVVAAYDSSISGGVRLNFTQCDDAITVTAILFAGLSKAATGGCTHNDTSSTHEEVGAAVDQFQPDLVIFVPSDSTLTSDTPNGALGLGFALNKAGIPQISAHLNYDQNTDPTDSDGFYRSDVASCSFIGDRIVSQDRFAITSFDSTGWNALAVDTGDLNSPQANYLALKFSSALRMACANMPVAAATGNQAFNSFGFTPDLVFGMAHLLSTSNTIVDGPTASAGAYFVTGKHGSRSVSFSMQEGLDINPATSVSKTQQGDHAVTCLEHTGTLALQAEWVGGSSSGGFVLNFTTAAQVGTLTALGIQLNFSAPRLQRRRARRATRRSRMRYRRTRAVGGVRVGQTFAQLWRAVQRFRRAMQVRLRPRRAVLHLAPTVTPVFSDEVADPAGGVFSAGSKRGDVFGGGSAEGSVYP